VATVKRALHWPRLWLGLWLLAVVGVIVLSLVPPPPLPLEPPKNFDKLMHVLAYFALAFGAVQLFERGRTLVWVALGLVLLGVLLEWAQGAMVPEVRMADPWDALANTMGVLLGMAAVATPLSTCLLRLERALAR